MDFSITAYDKQTIKKLKSELYSLSDQTKPFLFSMNYNLRKRINEEVINSTSLSRNTFSGVDYEKILVDNYLSDDEKIELISIRNKIITKMVTESPRKFRNRLCWVPFLSDKIYFIDNNSNIYHQGDTYSERDYIKGAYEITAENASLLNKLAGSQNFFTNEVDYLYSKYFKVLVNTPEGDVITKSKHELNSTDEYYFNKNNCLLHCKTLDRWVNDSLFANPLDRKKAVVEIERNQ